MVRGGTMGSRVVLGSIVRDGSKYLDRYFEQVSSLATGLEERGFGFANVVLEGDSTDDSWARLVQYYSTAPHSVRLIRHEHGGIKYGSVDRPDRWANIANCWNHLVGRVNEYEPTLDVFVYMEADLIWEDSTVRALVRHVMNGVDAVAPMSMLNGTDPPIFWDIHGHRAGGVRFNNNAPYHAWLDPRKVIPPDCYWSKWGLIKIGSAGSCGVFRGDIVRKCTFDPKDAMIGKSLYEQGFTFWLDPMLEVVHPDIHKGEH